MCLKEYRRRRDFSRTPEPQGEKCEELERIYVIQRHQSSRLHWDLRLELDGVLKSWAIPKEPPHERGIKRLAVQTEDHPVEYADFQGVIPEGQYGAGTVETWDRGTYQLLNRNESRIEILIEGKKLKGPFILLRTRWRGDDRNWLFFKMKKGS